MHRLAQLLVVIAAMVIAAWSLHVGSMAVDLALDYPRRLAGESPEYPARGTLAYYWNCVRAVAGNLTLFLPWFAPLWGTTMLAVVRCFKSSSNGRRTSSRIGLIAVLLVLVLYAAAWAAHGMSLMRAPSFLLPAIPAVILLFLPRWWPHALFMISAWEAYLLIGRENFTAWSFGSLHDAAWVAFVVSVFYVHASLAFQHWRASSRNPALIPEI